MILCMRKIPRHAKYLVRLQEVDQVNPRDKQYTDLNERLPEMRLPHDEIAEQGRALRLRREELRPQSDLQYWR